MNNKQRIWGAKYNIIYKGRKYVIFFPSVWVDCHCQRFSKEEVNYNNIIRRYKGVCITTLIFIYKHYKGSKYNGNIHKQ